MTTSVSWRGRLADPARIDEFEDALLELAMEFGGRFTPFDPEDRLRGGFLDLAPGLGRVPLGVARDGSLAGGPAKDGWVSAVTAHASPENRALLAEVLERIREEFCPGLEIRGAVQSDVALQRRVRAASSRLESRRPTIGANDPEGVDSQAEGTEEEWEAFYRRNHRRDAGIMRTMSHMNEGESEEPLMDAMKAEGIIGLEGEKAPFELDLPDEPEEPDEPALPRKSFEERMPPLVRRSLDLVCLIHKSGDRNKYDPLAPDAIVSAWVLELSGGLSQAIQSREDEDDDPTPFGIAVVQLKRALRGVEFCLGAIPACREAGRIKPAALTKIESDLKAFDTEIRKRLGQAWRSWARARGERG